MTFFFDLDGTLTDSREGIFNCIKYALESKGIIENDYDRLKKFIGPPLLNAFMEIYGVDETTGIELLEKYRERFSVKGMFENKLYDGIFRMLEALKKEGHRMAVVTGKPEVYSTQIVKHFGLDGFFDAVVGPDLSNNEEGKASLVKRAVAILGKGIMIGDRKFDIEGARENSLPSVAVGYGFGEEAELRAAKADYYVKTVEELQNLLLNM